MTPSARELVARCEAAGCCPLGAAGIGQRCLDPKSRGTSREPPPVHASRVLKIRASEALGVVQKWDGTYPEIAPGVTCSSTGLIRDREGAIRAAQALGLGPRILAGLARIEGEG